MKKNCLIIFKWPIFLNKFVVNKLSKFYQTEFLYLSDFKDKSFSEIIEEINDFIERKNINIVFFDVDSIKFINFFFIKKINKKVKKVLMTFDDTAIHEMNAITANACDLVVTHCPFSVLKYKEKGYEAYNMCLENDSDIFKSYNIEKDIDVLFFGRLNPDRNNFLNFLSNEGISIKKVGEDSNFLSIEELAKTISRSKIVINFSKTTKEFVTNYSSESIYKYYYELKGRVVMTGLCGTLCISEYSPGQTIMFNDNELLTFYNKEECLKILKKLLSDSNLLKENTTKFCNKVLNTYEENKNFEPIYKAIEVTENRKIELIKIPYWYLRIVAKQIIKRDIKITKLKKTLFQMGEIFKIIKSSNIHIKFLIILETIINIFWYSIKSGIKSNKLSTF